jgi:hypothetical protein
MRKFTPEFRADVVRLCQSGTESLAEVWQVLRSSADLYTRVRASRRSSRRRRCQLLLPSLLLRDDACFQESLAIAAPQLRQGQSRAVAARTASRAVLRQRTPVGAHVAASTRPGEPAWAEVRISTR